MTKENRRILVVCLGFIAVIFILIGPVKHTYRFDYVATTKDAVKVTIPIESTYWGEIFMFGKRERVEKSLRDYSTTATTMFVHNQTSLELYLFQLIQMKDVVFRPVKGVTNIILLNEITYEKAFMDSIKDGFDGNAPKVVLDNSIIM